MKFSITFSIVSMTLFFISLSCGSNKFQQVSNKPNFAIVIHGGAGGMASLSSNTEKKASYKSALEEALIVGETILKNGGSSLDAVEQTIMVLENNPLFNAGKGAVTNEHNTFELDASIMQGQDLNAGAVGGVTKVKNPIMAARKVMTNSPHVLLVGEGANYFSQSMGLQMVEPDYFKKPPPTSLLLNENIDKMGTVGCVAIDKNGDIAAGTSTGGMSGKKWNRVGDSPIIGAGTYANNATCGISCTGHGEFFIRYAVAHDASAMMEYKKTSLSESCNTIIHQKLVKAGGKGGLIGIDAKYNIVMSFNTNAMFRAYSKNGERASFIFGAKHSSY